jgi:hypothetical protein
MTGSLPGRTSAPPFADLGRGLTVTTKKIWALFLNQFLRLENMEGITGEEVGLM